jgi:plastocyanin
MNFLLIFGLLFGLVFAESSQKMTPTLEISVIVTKEGYYPKSISVFEGEKIKFYVTSTTEEPHCLIVESHKVFLAANKGKITEAEVSFDKSGEFAFYCPSSKNDGRIVVLKKVVPKREVASEKKSEAMLWTPKEY